MKASITLDLDDVEYSWEYKLSDTPIIGNAMASGDDQFDRQVEKSIIRDINCGNYYAWCDVTVTATLGVFEGIATLGACSVSSEDEIKTMITDHDMYNEALEDLKQNLKLSGATFHGEIT